MSPQQEDENPRMNLHPQRDLAMAVQRVALIPEALTTGIGTMKVQSMVQQEVEPPLRMASQKKIGINIKVPI